MAKKTLNTNDNFSTIRLCEPYRLYAKYCERALVPFEAVDKEYRKLSCRTKLDFDLKSNAKFVTLDNKSVKIELIGVFDNTEDFCTSTLKTICDNLYSIPFETLYSIWFSRVGEISGMWYLIGMELYG